MKNIKGKFVVKDSTEVKYTSGSYGNITSAEELNLSFFHDMPQDPTEYTVEVSDNNQMIKQNLVGSDTMIRNVHTKLVMSIKTAKSIKDWLVHVLEEYDKNNGVQ